MTSKLGKRDLFCLCLHTTVHCSKDTRTGTQAEQEPGGGANAGVHVAYWLVCHGRLNLPSIEPITNSENACSFNLRGLDLYWGSSWESSYLPGAQPTGITCGPWKREAAFRKGITTSKPRAFLPSALGLIPFSWRTKQANLKTLSTISLLICIFLLPLALTEGICELAWEAEGHCSPLESVESLAAATFRFLGGAVPLDNKLMQAHNPLHFP